MATVWRTQCAFARLFAGKCGQILNNATDLGTKLAPESLSALATRKYSSYNQSPLVEKITEQYGFEIVKKPPEWKYVERLLPFDTIPAVKPKESYPSGWIPPKDEAKNLPYFIPRNKHHDLNIYLKITHRGMCQISRIRKIEGDIWLMNDEVRAYLKEKHGRYIATRVHEFAKFIEIKGDYVNDLRDWAISKGF